MDLMGLKSKILEELMEDLDDHEGMNLKPKAAISVTAVKPGADVDSDPASDPMAAAAGSGDGDDMDDDELRKLIEAYAMSK